MYTFIFPTLLLYISRKETTPELKIPIATSHYQLAATKFLENIFSNLICASSPVAQTRRTPISSSLKVTARSVILSHSLSAHVRSIVVFADNPHVTRRRRSSPGQSNLLSIAPHVIDLGLSRRIKTLSLSPSEKHFSRTCTYR